ncbi:MAG: hypothetical protein JST52_07880 [Bacteroidetes bacterium]|nr:hypothetical protein [Bacteroidota bacterium]MBS1739928.1 hypothetical protein [Bacteroidota bacterium]
MALPYFGGYIGSLLLLAGLFAFMAKNLADSLTGQGKKPYIYGALSSLLAALIAWAGGLLTRNLFFSFWVLSSVFLLFGIIHQWWARKKYFFSLQHNKGKIMLAEIFFGLGMMLFVVGVFSSLQYFLKGDRSYLFYPMVMSGLFFFLPMLIQSMFTAALDIPAREYEAWPYPLFNPPSIPEEDPNEKVLVIGFEMAKKSGQTLTYFRAKAPENIKLGHLFCFFVSDYNDQQSETPIEVADASEMPHQWIFSKKRKWYQPRKMYNAERNFRENGIFENTIIIAERV